MSDQSQTHILIIDDNRDLAENLCEILTEHGYETRAAYDARGGIALCKESPFDIALVDVRLPDAQGPEVIVKLFEMQPDISCILMTGHASLESAIRSVGQPGLVGYETKPLDMDHLLALLGEIAARKHAEQQQQIQERKYRTIFETAANLILCLDSRGTILECSRTVKDLTGHQPEDLMGRPLSAFVHKKHRAKLQASLKECLARGRLHNHENTFINIHGESVDVSLNATRLDDETPGPQVICFVEDITERNRTEESLRLALEESRRRRLQTSALLASSRAVMEHSDFEDAARAIFTTCKNLLGAKAGFVANILEDMSLCKIVFMETGGLPFHQDPGEPIEIKGMLMETCLQGQVVVENNYAESQWGRREVHGHPTFENVVMAPMMIMNAPVGLIGLANKPGGFSEEDVQLVGAFAEIAAVSLFNSRMFHSLKNSEARFRSVAQSAVDAIVSFDGNGLIVFSNNAAEEIFGYSEEEIKGRPISMILSPDLFSKSLRERIDRAAAEDGSEIIETTIETLGKNKDGGTLPLELSLASWETNEAVFFTSIIRDISDRKRLEQERSALQQQLLQSQKMEAIGTLAGGVAHDFNNMLAIIMGNAQLGIEEIGADEPGGEEFREILAAAKRAKDLTMKMLTFARKELINVKADSLNRIILDLVVMLSRSVPKKININTDIGKNLPLVQVDANQIQQAFLNICNNACDAMPDGGHLSIQVKQVSLDHQYSAAHSGIQPGHYCRVCIQDTGAGMTPEIRDKIFEPFFTTKSMGKGTGLGLSITFGIIKNHGGFIEVDSAPDKGTGISVYLPVSENLNAGNVENGTTTTLPGGSETILIVDDEEAVLRFAEKMLARAGYSILTAGGGPQAVGIFAENAQNIDLVVLDVIMPNMDGSDVYRELKKINADVRVVLASGYSMDSQSAELFQLGVYGFMQKPFDEEELCRTVRNALDSQHPHKFK